ncbi:MAG TPA: lysophospholipid acyltransferase family protein [Polyangiaceae bacterium]|nr:lysophospholipid acyltransferase family protein [Polyangiaceae bacterium]
MALPRETPPPPAPAGRAARAGAAPADPARPTPDELALLSGFERLAFRLCAEANHRPALKRAGHAYLRQVGARFVYACLGNRMRIDGLEAVRRLAPDRGVVLASNHRSFFDLYAIACVLMRERVPWVERMYFPVRSNYFYDRPDGVLLNAAIAALSMYPPVMRDAGRRPFNQFATRLLGGLLREPGTLVGIHPEGRRNRDPDPYALLPAQPGVGQMVHEARPIVLPVFLRGLTNDFLGQTWQNVTHRGEPLTIVFGEPLAFGSALEGPARLRTYKRLADEVLAAIAALGERERAFRAGLAKG